MTFHAVVKSSSLTQNMSQTLNVWSVYLQTGYLLLTVHVGKYSIHWVLGYGSVSRSFWITQFDWGANPTSSATWAQKNLAPASRVVTDYGYHCHEDQDMYIVTVWNPMSWIYPPAPVTVAFFRFIGIPYQRCKNPGGAWHLGEGWTQPISIQQTITVCGSVFNLVRSENIEETRVKLSQ